MLSIGVGNVLLCGRPNIDFNLAVVQRVPVGHFSTANRKEGGPLMTWESRNGRRYFYRSQRDGAQVRKIYVGAGDAGRAAELAIDLRREQRQGVRDWLHQTAQTFAELDAIDAELAVGLAAVLYARYGQTMDARAARRTARKQGAFVMESAYCDPPLSPTEQETWRQLRERASRGDREATTELLPFLDQHPQLQEQLGDLSRLALNRWIDLVAGRDEIAKRTTHSKVLQLIASLQRDATDPLEQLLTRRVGMLWLQASYVDIQLAQAMSRTPQEQEFLAKRQHITQQAYATAIRAVRDYQQASGAVASRENVRPGGRRQPQQSLRP